MDKASKLSESISNESMTHFSDIITDIFFSITETIKLLNNDPSMSYDMFQLLLEFIIIYV